MSKQGRVREVLLLNVMDPKSERAISVRLQVFSEGLQVQELMTKTACHD